LLINESIAKVYVFGKEVDLTHTEYAIVLHLHDNRPNVCPRSSIIATAWPDIKAGDIKDLGMEATLNVNLANIRKKLREASGGFTFLETIQKRGIRMLV
jgi:DNA-binding winged helix-turn-helix (wHTH) protein